MHNAAACLSFVPADTCRHSSEPKDMGARCQQRLLHTVQACQSMLHESLWHTKTALPTGLGRDIKAGVSVHWGNGRTCEW
jgi:hypothetical protein